MSVVDEARERKEGIRAQESEATGIPRGPY